MKKETIECLICEMAFTSHENEEEQFKGKKHAKQILQYLDHTKWFSWETCKVNMNSEKTTHGP